MSKIKKTVLITGGSKRIGLKIAKTLLQNNFNVIITFNKSKKAAIELCSAFNKKDKICYALKVDLKKNSQVLKMFEKARKVAGPISCLINNASIFEYDNISNLKSKNWNNHLQANLEAPIFLSQAFYKALPKSMDGNIINILDQRVLNLTPHFLSYTISKTALWTATKTLALDLAPRIRVNAIGPGPTIKSIHQSAKQFKAQCKSTPLKIGADPEDIAKAVLFLISIKSITGQLIVIDGGQHLGWGQVNKKGSQKD